MRRAGVLSFNFDDETPRQKAGRGLNRYHFPLLWCASMQCLVPTQNS